VHSSSQVATLLKILRFLQQSQELKLENTHTKNNLVQEKSNKTGVNVLAVFELGNECEIQKTLIRKEIHKCSWLPCWLWKMAVIIISNNTAIVIIIKSLLCYLPAFSALTLLAGRKEEYPACKN